MEAGYLKKNQPILRLAVWHHALEGKWAMQDDEFMEHLQCAGVKLCLHGDVHENRRKVFDPGVRPSKSLGPGRLGHQRKGVPNRLRLSR